MTESVRRALPTPLFCSSRDTVADDTHDYSFRPCLHSLLCKARYESDQLLNALPLTSAIDRRRFHFFFFTSVLGRWALLENRSNLDSRSRCPASCHSACTYY